MKLALLALAVMLLAAPSFGQVMMKGDFIANVNTEGWNLNSGNGYRTHVMFVKFPKAFAKEPTVMVTLTSYDGAAGKDGNVRVSIKADQITREGFTVKTMTWGDSRLAGVEGSWFAFTNK